MGEAWIGGVLDEFTQLPSVFRMRHGVVDLGGVPEKGQAILALRAFGLSLRQIAKVVGINQGNVAGYLKRYDPEGLCEVSDEDRRRISTRMLNATAVAALLNITPEKLEESSAGDLAGIAAKCISAAERIREGDREEKGRKAAIDSAMEYIDGLAEAEEAG